ncbi:MAG: hypothetical protein LQ348_004871 [Seirophora lacunosa]|nr:MAG: hypothetical protein LQ348_004871 [Seirophora lacunosa]
MHQLLAPTGPAPPTITAAPAIRWIAMNIPPVPRFAVREEPPWTSSPSPSKSLHKRLAPAARSWSPLLSHLTLEASNVPNETSHHDFYQLAAAAAPSERALAIRAALAGRQLEEWHEELQQWQWPSSHNGFEAPDHQNPAHRPNQHLSNASADNTENGNGTSQEYWGSLHAQTVTAYEIRVEEIRDAMDALELNELKMHVRDVHFASISRPSSAISSLKHNHPDPGYNYMDDFTATVTTIIMQALPVIFRVEALLSAWEVRLAVLRAVPGFFAAMSRTQEEMAVAWQTLDRFVREAGADKRHQDVDGEGSPTHGQEHGSVAWLYLLEVKARLEIQIRDLGQRLDFQLDTLEGRQDTIPDAWIDDMERLEAEFGDWVVEAERIAVEWELRSEDHQSEQHLDLTKNPSIAQSSSGIETGDNLQTAAEAKPSADELAAVSTDSSTAKPTASPSRLSPLPMPTIAIGNDAQDGSTSVPDVRADAITDWRESVEYLQRDDFPLHSHRPPPLKLSHRRDHSNALSELSIDSSYLGSATSDYFSNMSSPEIHDASKTEYFGVGSPVEVTTPGLPRRESQASEVTVSRQSSQRTERADRPLSAIASPTRSRASTVGHEPTISEDPGSATATTMRDRRSLPNFAFGNGLPDGDAHEPAAPGDPEPTPPIPSKSRHRFEDFADLSPGNTPVKVIRRKTADAGTMPSTAQAKKSRTPAASSAKSPEEELEARITSILTDIPANIQLARNSTSRNPDSSAGRMSQSPASRATRLVKRSATPRLMRSQTAVPSPPVMTLTPADQKLARPQYGDPETRLYHLYQPGKDAPIKLLVRLVGEGGERVMVRIGGGWADLAEYLTEYAIHHGRRTVSDGRFDFQALPHSQPSSPVTPQGLPSNSHTPKSRPGSPIAERSSPGAALRSRRFTIGRLGSPSTTGDARSSPDEARPSSRNSNASSKGSWLGGDSPSLGLAGPKSRKATVSPNKQAWVDTMMEKAKTGSSEKQKGTRNAFGDLGIIGGTKRLFMKAERKHDARESGSRLSSG